MEKFKIDPSKALSKKAYAIRLEMDPDLYRWIKVVAAITDVNIPCALNQVVEYAKKNSEKISI